MAELSAFVVGISGHVSRGDTVRCMVHTRANQTVQRIGASRFALRQIERQWRLAPIAALAQCNSIMTRDAKLAVATGVGGLGLLAVMGVSTVLQSRAAGRVASTTAWGLAAASACSNYQADFGVWPTSLHLLLTNAQGTVYLDVRDSRGLVDGWGRAFVFGKPDGAGGVGWLLSYGQDGIAGGSGADADIRWTFGGASPQSGANQTRQATATPPRQ